MTYTPDSRFARSIDKALDLLLVGVLLGAPLIFYTRGHDVFEFNKITAVRDFSALAMLLMIVKMLFVRPISLARSPLDFPLLAWLAAAAIATFHTVNVRLSLHGVYEDFEGITTLVNYAFLLYWPLQHVRKERQVKLMLGTVILAGTIMGFYGILQNVNIDFVPWNPTTYSSDRMFSTMGNPNFLAAYVVMSLPVCFVVFLDLPDKVRTDKRLSLILVAVGAVASVGLWGLFGINYFSFAPEHFNVETLGQVFATKKFWTEKILLIFPLMAAILLYFGRLRVVILVSMIFQIVATLFTKSRGGALALGVLGLFFVLFFIWESRRQSGVLKRNRWWLTSLVLGLGLTLLIPEVWDTTAHLAGRVKEALALNYKYTQRLFIWRSALAMLRDNFFFGWGLDTFQVVFPQYREILYWILEWNGTPEKAHNMIMQIAATMGFFGLFSFLWLNAAWFWRFLRDLREQASSSRRMLLAGAFAAVLGFVTQNLFSFTVVGYGSLYWIMLGLMPAMARVWARQEATQTSPHPLAENMPPAPLRSGEGRGAASDPSLAPMGGGVRSGLGAWRLGLGLLVLTALLCLLAGPRFSLSDQGLAPRVLAFGAGLACLGLLLLRDDPSQASPGLRWALVSACGLGLLFFSWHSTKIWVADSFYKQGQVGTQVGQPGYAAAMYQKSAGRIETITPEQLQFMLQPLTPTSDALRVQYIPGLNPDQELYWVRMGIAFENAAAMTADPQQKQTYYFTALAIHQLTLEFNPINGYNYNNKGRVLKAMGEALHRADFLQAALAHYDRATSLDKNNVYFNMDYANTYLSLGDVNSALRICLRLIDDFPDFAVPYSYAGFIKMRSGQAEEAIRYFQMAIEKDWKSDIPSRALAATNLGLLYAKKNLDRETQRSYYVALISNPGLPESFINLINWELKKGRPHQARAVLNLGLQRSPQHPNLTALNASLKPEGSPQSAEFQNRLQQIIDEAQKNPWADLTGRLNEAAQWCQAQGLPSTAAALRDIAIMRKPDLAAQAEREKQDFVARHPGKAAKR